MVLSKYLVPVFLPPSVFPDHAIRRFLSNESLTLTLLRLNPLPNSGTPAGHRIRVQILSSASETLKVLVPSGLCRFLLSSDHPSPTSAPQGLSAYLPIPSPIHLAKPSFKTHVNVTSSLFCAPPPGLYIKP